MIRAAAKNHDGVAVLVDPADYPALLAEIAATGGTEAGSAASALRPRRSPAPRPTMPRSPAGSPARPARRSRSGWCWPARAAAALRYGENPHQRAAFYATGGVPTGLAAAAQLQGKELSFNNLNDTDAALALVAELSEPAVAIIKHANPCGVAMAPTPARGLSQGAGLRPAQRVRRHRRLQPAARRSRAPSEIARIFTEVVIAPGSTTRRAQIFAAKPNLRLLTTGRAARPGAAGRDVKWLAGGFLAQDRDTARRCRPELRVATPARADATPSWPICCSPGRWSSTSSRTRSCWRADGATVGIGVGQTSRVDAVHLAARKRRPSAAGSRPCVVASDAFFPFADGLWPPSRPAPRLRSSPAAACATRR